MSKKTLKVDPLAWVEALLSQIGVSLIGKRRIGIDFGRCIADNRDNRGRKIPISGYSRRPEIEFAIRVIRFLVVVFGAESIYIIRNGFGPNGERDDQVRIKAEIENWFRKKRFFERTSVHPDHVFHPETRQGKQELCIRLRLTDLIEDRAEVAQFLTETRWIAFNPTGTDVADFLHSVDDAIVNRMVRVSNWIEVAQAFFDPIGFEPTRVIRASELWRIKLDLVAGQVQQNRRKPRSRRNRPRKASDMRRACQEPTKTSRGSNKKSSSGGLFLYLDGATISVLG